jgi:hypothetical protein
MMRLLFDLLTKDGYGLPLLLFAMADDIETSLPEMIEREIRSVEWDKDVVDGSF